MAVSVEGHGAHTHGVAHLTLAYENGVLEVQFESPAESLLGFEHKPKTQAHVSAIEKAKALLNSSQDVLFLNGANCTPNTVNVNFVGPAGEPLDDGDVHQHGDHDSHVEHSDKHAEEDKGQHAHHDDAQASHSEINALYLFDCADNQAPESVTTSLFTLFAGLELIKVSWVTETQQGQNILQASASTLQLK